MLAVKRTETCPVLFRLSQLQFFNLLFSGAFWSALPARCTFRLELGVIARKPNFPNYCMQVFKGKNSF